MRWSSKITLSLVRSVIKIPGQVFVLLHWDGFPYKNATQAHCEESVWERTSLRYP